MLQTSVGRLRVAGILEGISFLVLLGIAMPLKYMMGMPEAVQVCGWAHGVLFVAYCVLLYVVQMEKEWPLTTTAMFFVAALIPFGPFIMDARLKDDPSKQENS